MENKYLQQKIERLDISSKIIDLLKENGITKIQQLCRKSKTELKNLGLKSLEINKIAVELQLLGLDLKSN